MSPSEILPDKERFQEKIEMLQRLPHFGLIRQISEMAADPDTSLQAIAEVISRDISISGRLLRLINSPLYGFPGKISTVSQALILVGIDVLKGLIITSTMYETLPRAWFSLWRHSLIVSRACRQIGRMIKARDPEEFATIGLLHDIGKVAFIKIAKSEYTAIHERSIRTGQDLISLEKSLLGFTHADVSGWLCKKWFFPDKLTYPIQYHHEPENSPQFQDRAYAVFAANVLAGQIEGGVKDIKVVCEPLFPSSDGQMQEERFASLIDSVKRDYLILRDANPGDI